MTQLPQALAPLAAYSQFMIFKAVPSTTKPGKFDKFPCDFRTGKVVSAHEAQYWTDSATAMAAVANFGQPYGLAFVFTDNDPFWFIDIDNCLQDDGQWSPIAQQLCGLFAGAAVERSHSGRGLHIFGAGAVPPHGCKNATYGLEFYHHLRFVALTGDGAIGNAAQDFTHVLPALVNTYFPPSDEDLHDALWTDGPSDDWRGPTDDDELIRRACRSKSVAAAFGGKASFADLWEGNGAVLANTWPDATKPEGYDASHADAALAQHLAFWTGRDCERIERLMCKSGLYREKFDRKDGQFGTYLRRTITGACARQVDVLQDAAPPPPPMMTTQTPPPAPGSTVVPQAASIERFDGNYFLDINAQLSLFAGCVYVTDRHRVLVPGGKLLTPQQFRVIYGGYIYQLDNSNERTTRDPFEALTCNQAHRVPKVETICFKPELPFGTIIERGGERAVNTFSPVTVARQTGDPTPFLVHLAKVLPNIEDQQILLCYMAACVQHQGVKFQWAPLLQGVEGNGKTLFTRCVVEAVGRRYVHFPKASKLAKEFNAWMVGKVFFAVEDIYTPGDRREVIEELKPMITGEDLEIEGKGVDQLTMDICGNFMFNSNHKDAIAKTKRDRRFCVMYCAQQNDGDLARDGMTGSYFENLYNWLKSGGYAIVAELLHTYPIPDHLNPATGCQRAPETSSTVEAIQASVGGIEQEILEAVGQGKPGFLGGWISSVQLERLLADLGLLRRITHHRRKEMLQEMGYVYHPALRDGRVNNVVVPDNAKPRLFIHKDSPDFHITNAADAAKAYEAANSNFPFHTTQ